MLGYRRDYLQLFFRNQNDLFAVRRELLPIATKNREQLDAVDTYAEVIAGESRFGASMEYDMEDGGERQSFAQVGAGAGVSGQASDNILDIREYDIPYYLRVAIDKGPPLNFSFPPHRYSRFHVDIRVGLWYEVSAEHGDIKVTLIKERVSRAEPVVMAFDIETTKAPLKFPDQQTDQVMMISYMIDGQVRFFDTFCLTFSGEDLCLLLLQGFLITNREIVGADIEDFEYTPKPEYEGPFTIFNEEDEVRSCSLIQYFCPLIFFAAKACHSSTVLRAYS